MRLYLVRHGETHSNVGALLDTAYPGAELTELGQRQAEALVPALGGVGIGSLYVSNLRRTHATAAPLGGALRLTPQQHDGLREVSAGDLEMRGDRESVMRYLGVAGSWIGGELNARMPGGESGAEVFERFDAAVEHMAGGGHENVAAVSHGAMIRIWAGVRAQDVDLDMVTKRGIPNTGGVVLEGEPGDWRLVSWHDQPFGVDYLA